MEKKYWIVEFCSFKKKWTLNNGQDINQVIKEYMTSQNKGEAKSDRIYLRGKKKVTKEQYDSTHTLLEEIL